MNLRRGGVTGPTRSLPFLLSFSPLSFPSTSLSLRIKTEVLWCSTGCRQRQIPHHPVRIGADWSFPADSVRNLRIYLDCDASMRVHVSKTVSNCFAALRQIWSIRRCVPRQVLVSLVVSLVLSRLDYGNATLAGLPGYLSDRLQSVLTAAARVVNPVGKFEHATPLLRDLH